MAAQRRWKCAQHMGLHTRTAMHVVCATDSPCAHTRPFTWERHSSALMHTLCPAGPV